MKIDKPGNSGLLRSRRRFGSGISGKKKRQTHPGCRVPCLKPLRLADARNVITHICAKYALPQKRQLVAGLRGFFEFEIFGVIHHLLFEPLDFLRYLLSMMSLIRLVTPRGVIPIARLCAICFVRRRSVSPIARFIESVTLSP